MKKPTVTLAWSKGERDWILRYPEWPNRDARILGHNFFTMIQEFEQQRKGDTLRQLISDAGFDPDTFTITVKAKEQEETAS